jgi:HAD superfamily hydrolase (TIGR01450 family)
VPLELDLEDAEGFVFDVDGTLVQRGRDHALHLVPGAVEALTKLRESGRPFVVFTNGTHIQPRELAAELRAVGLPVDDDAALTPVDSFLTYAERRHPGARVLLLATPPARERIAASGVTLAQDGEEETADVVFVAHVQDVSLAQLESAARAVVAGAPLLTASYVSAYSGADGPIFSRGAMTTAAIAKAAARRPTIVGKPSRAAVRTVVDRLGIASDRLVVVGDDVRMDIGLGHTGKSRTVLVRTGITGGNLSGVSESRRPHAVIDSIAELVPAL